MDYCVDLRMHLCMKFSVGYDVKLCRRICPNYRGGGCTIRRGAALLELNRLNRTNSLRLSGADLHLVCIWLNMSILLHDNGS